jgi:DNA repair protein RadD
MLRDFQQDLDQRADNAHARGARNVMIVSPTGSGKTVVMGHRIKKRDAPTVAMVHRQELVGQIAMALNREELPHGVAAPPAVIKSIITAQMELHGRSFYSPNAAVRVASTMSLKRYVTENARWADQVRLAVCDEGHHVLRENMFGRAMAMFRNAEGDLYTAHAHRADGSGLGRHADGVVDELVIGPSGRMCINRGYLTDYRVICPPSDINMEGVEVGANGELNMEMTRERIHASKTIVGDVVKHYRKYADGELGITFAVDTLACTKICDAYNAAGIPAAIISYKTPITQRAHIMRLYRERKIIQLVNVDCLGEGTDVPACVVVSMVRPSASFQLVAQQFGRMLRIMVSDELNQLWHGFTDEQRVDYISRSSKPRGILIDHVGNIAIAGGIGRHGLPDRPRTYTLDRRERRRQAPDDAIPLRVCLNLGWTAPLWEQGPITGIECLQPYETVLSACPHCGFPRPAPKLRGSPEHVEGDLVELDAEVLAELRGEIDRIDSAPRMPFGADAMVAASVKRKHHERQAAQVSLRDAMMLYGGWQEYQGRDTREGQRRFFHQYGLDVMTAQTLNAKDAAELEARIRATLAINNVIKAVA